MMGPITISTTTSKVSEFMTSVTDLGYIAKCSIVLIPPQLSVSCGPHSGFFFFFFFQNSCGPQLSLI